MNGPREPSADQRVAAAQMYGMYLALLAEGFTEQQALVIIGQILVAASQRPQGES